MYNTNQKKYFSFKPSSIHQVLVKWSVTGIMLIVLMASVNIYINSENKNSQTVLVTKAIPIESLSRSINLLISDLILRQKRILTTNSLSEFNYYLGRSEYEQQYIKLHNQLLNLTTEYPELTRIIHEINKKYDLFMQHDELITNTQKIILLNRELLFSQFDLLSSAARDIIFKLNEISGIIDMQIGYARRGLHEETGSSIFDSDSSNNITADSFLDAYRKVQIPVNTLIQDIKEITRLSNEAVHESDIDNLSNLRDNEIMQNLGSFTSVSTVLKYNISGSSALIKKIIQIDEDLSEMSDFLLNKETSVFNIRFKILKSETMQKVELDAAEELIESLNNDLDQLIDLVNRLIESEVRKTESTYRYNLFLTLIVGSIVFLMAFMSISIVMRRINKPLTNVTRAMASLSKGELETRLDNISMTKDEFLDLAINFNKFAENNQKVIAELIDSKNELMVSEAKFRNIVEGSLQGVFIYKGFMPLFINQQCADIFGYDKPEDMLEMSFKTMLKSCIPPGEHERLRGYILARAQGDTVVPADYECQGIKRDGSLIWIENRVTSISWNDEAAIQIAVIDITDRKRAEDELMTHSRAVEESSSMIFITDIRGNIEYVNSKFTDATGFTKAEIIGENIISLRSNETPDSVYEELKQSIASTGEWKGELRSRKKDGSLYWEQCSIFCIRNDDGDITHYVNLQDDVTYEHELTEKLSHQASHDALTGLVNRREFERRTNRLLSTIRQDKTEHALCFMDLDQFKVINDTCGHTAGDELLRQISAVLEEKVRQRDTLARLGGDEFGLLMEHCSLDHAHRVAIALQEAVHEFQFIWEKQRFKIGISIGLVTISESMTNLSELMKQADAACYMAKDLGRNRIHIYHPEDVDLAQRHGEIQWVTRLHSAIEENRFCIYAQPIVALNRSKAMHYELLLRMNDEQGKLILPNAFLPAAERYDLMAQIDRWVIETALSLLSENPTFVGQIHFVSINLSGQSLTDLSFLNFVIDQVNESGIDGSKICFEITETAAISNLSTAIKFISTLKGLNCRFALDDFGSGLSSFGYLKNLPVDYLKIDGMFVRDIADDPIDRAMVKSINEIGQVMGMKTIAEFVENDEIKGMLKEIGVNYAQGYGIGKPLPFEELLSRSNNVAKIKKA